jgi:hypothetical protein
MHFDWMTWFVAYSCGVIVTHIIDYVYDKRAKKRERGN